MKRPRHTKWEAAMRPWVRPVAGTTSLLRGSKSKQDRHPLTHTAPPYTQLEAPRKAHPPDTIPGKCRRCPGTGGSAGCSAASSPSICRPLWTRQWLPPAAALAPHLPSSHLRCLGIVLLRLNGFPLLPFSSPYDLFPPFGL